MGTTLHITFGDIVGGSLAKAGLPGEVFVWHDILYDGPRKPGWPDEAGLAAQAAFIEQETGGGLKKDEVLSGFKEQYQRIADLPEGQHIVLWFDACLFDMAMLAHVLMCLDTQNQKNVELIVIDACPGIEPYIGIGQLSPEQLAGYYDAGVPVTEEQFAFANKADKAFALRERELLAELENTRDAVIPWVPAAARRLAEEIPDPKTGLGRLERMALEAIRDGCETPEEIYKAVTEKETPPQYWGDTTLWGKVNGLADKGLVKIDGEKGRLPQWNVKGALERFVVAAS